MRLHKVIVGDFVSYYLDRTMARKCFAEILKAVRHQPDFKVTINLKHETSDVRRIYWNDGAGKYAGLDWTALDLSTPGDRLLGIVYQDNRKTA